MAPSTPASITTAGQTSRRNSSSYVPCPLEHSSDSSILNLTQPLPTSTSTSLQGRRRWLRKDLSPNRICGESLPRGTHPSPCSSSATSIRFPLALSTYPPTLIPSSPRHISQLYSKTMLPRSPSRARRSNSPFGTLQAKKNMTDYDHSVIPNQILFLSYSPSTFLHP